MHHARVQSMNSEDQDHDHGYTDESSNEVENGSGNAKRRRVSGSWVNVSCQLCKTRKVKCDRTLPSCGWCTRNSAACEYKERKKPGLRAGYGRELEQRLDKLEGILLQHSEVLARALGHVQDGFANSNGVARSDDDRRWSVNESQRGSDMIDTSPAKPPYAFHPRQLETVNPTSAAVHGTNGFALSHVRRDSVGIPYSAGQHHRDFAPVLPAINTVSPAHDRRPSVTFMNNPTSPPPFHVKPPTSQSPPYFASGVLKRDTTSPQYPPLLTPNTTASSSAHSPQHVQDYMSAGDSQHKSTISTSSTAQSLQQRYPFNPAFSSYTDYPLPPWPVMHELAVLYFTNINSVLPLVSEKTVFETILNPRRLEADDGSDIDIRAVLMAITVVTMRLLPAGHLTTKQKDYYVKRSRDELACSGYQKTKEGVQALAVLLLGSNGDLGREETQQILGHVTERLGGFENDGRRQPQSPLSVDEMLCPA